MHDEKEERAEVATGGIGMKRRKHATEQDTQHALNNAHASLNDASEEDARLHVEMDVFRDKEEQRSSDLLVDNAGSELHQGRGIPAVVAGCNRAGQPVRGGNMTLSGSHIIIDHYACMKECDSVLKKVLETLKAHKAADEASMAAIGAVDRNSIEADRVARMELQHATQRLQSLQEDISSLIMQRCAILPHKCHERKT